MIGDLIGEWIKGILIDGIMGNLSGLFNTVNTKVGEIASDVGSTPQDWNGGIFSMLQNLSETVIVPIAAAILALVMCYELIDMIVEKNNMHDFDSSMFFRWIFKSAFAILIVTNTWNIVMGVFDATQQVVNQSAGVIIGDTSIDFDTLLPDLESRLEAMDIGPLLGLWFQTLVVGLTMNILSICIFLVTYGRMIEIYAVTALGPIPLATLGNAEWRGMGQNYLKYLPESVPVTTLPEERMQFTLGFYGDGDFYTMKGVIEEFLESIGMMDKKEYDPKSGKNFLHPGRQANILYGGKVLGYLGEVHPEVLDNYGIGTKAYVAVLDMPEIIPFATFDRKYEGIAKYPAVTRDISMVVPREILVGQIEAVIAQRGGKILESYALFDIYEGSQIKAGFKSVAYTLTFRAKDRTLEDADVSAAMKKILNGLQGLGIELRQ